MIGEGYARAMTAFILTAVGVAFGLGVLLTWGLPKLWAWIKPWIHQVTA